MSIEITIYSKSWRSYTRLEAEYAAHEVENQQAHEYVRGAVSIDGIDGFSSSARERLIKHHRAKPKHCLFRLKEMKYRPNYRELETAEFSRTPVQVLVTNGDPCTVKCE